MRTLAEVETVLGLTDLGLTDVEVARRTGIPRSTVRDWRRGRIPGQRRGARRKSCPICNSEEQLLPEHDYAYLLGLYLGDGYVSRAARTYNLRIFLDAAYPNIVESCRAAVQAVRPDNSVWVGRSKTCR